MDDLFLYNHIKQAIKQRKQSSKDTNQQNFAESYCRRELMKKKLNLNTPNSNAKNKMNSLMKNFAHVDTYVDLNELLYSINLIRTKELADKKMATIQQKHRASRISRTRDLQKLNKPPLSCFSESATPSVDPIEVLKDRFRSDINERIKRNYQSDNSEMTEILKYLEEESQLNNSLLKNNSADYLSHLNQELQRIEKIEEIDGDTYAQNQKIFRQLTQSIGQHSVERQPRTEYFKSTNLNSKQKKQQNLLLHKISTFLQIALENQHKQKWATKELRKFRSTHGSFRFNKSKDERSNFFLKSINMQNEKKEKEIFQNIQQNPNSTKVSKKNILRRNQNFFKKLKSQQRNIFDKKSVDCESRAMNQTGTSTKINSSFIVSQSKKEQSNQNTHIFKQWDKNRYLEQRKTAPVNHENIFNDFAITTTKENNIQSSEQQEKKDGTDVFLTLNVVPKKQFILNKNKQPREYTFIKPNKNKTFLVGSSSNSEVKDQIKEKNIKDRSLQTDGFINIIRQRPSQTQAYKKSPKSTQIISESFLNTQQTLKKFQSTKNNLLSQTFTFKKRGKKQQIINKLQSFIEQINNQQKMSKAQNEYYDSAINHLQELSKNTYKNYEPQALAGYQEISELKKFVNSINPSLSKNKSKNKMMR